MTPHMPRRTSEEQAEEQENTTDAPENSHERYISKSQTQQSAQKIPPWTTIMVVALAIYMHISDRTNGTAKESQERSRQTGVTPTCEKRNKKPNKRHAARSTTHPPQTASAPHTGVPLDNETVTEGLCAAA